MPNKQLFTQIKEKIAPIQNQIDELATKQLNIEIQISELEGKKRELVLRLQKEACDHPNKKTSWRGGTEKICDKCGATIAYVPFRYGNSI